MLGIVAAAGCERAERPKDVALSPGEIRQHVNSLNRAAAERWARAGAKVLQEPADLVGQIEEVWAVPDSIPTRRVTVRYEPRIGQPGPGERRVSFVLRGEGAVWRHDRTVLPLDSLRVGDGVKVWMTERGTAQPTDPPLVSVRAIQRVDSVPQLRGRTRPAA